MGNDPINNVDPSGGFLGLSSIASIGVKTLGGAILGAGVDAFTGGDGKGLLIGAGVGLLSGIAGSFGFKAAANVVTVGVGMAANHAVSNVGMRTTNSNVSNVNYSGGSGGAIAIFFPGANFGENSTNPNPVAKGVEACPNVKTSITYRSIYLKGDDANTDDAFEQVSNFKKLNPDGKVSIYGYSYGGILANNLAHRLTTAGIKTAILVTVDAANGPWSDEIDRSIDDGVDVNYNFYENNISESRPPWSHGHQNSGTRKGQVNNRNMTNDTYNGKPINHYNIDEATNNACIIIIIKFLSQ
jgi:hypothetical protein